jgi:hypothetical protein
METMQEAIERLEKRGFEIAFRALPGGELGARLEGADEVRYPAETMRVDEIVRFEGRSDPDDEAVLFALRSPDEVRGTFAAAYGPHMEAETVAVVEKLDSRDAPGAGASLPLHGDLIEPCLQEALAAEHFVKQTGEQLLEHDVVAADAQATLVVRLARDRASEHVEALERLLEARDEVPSGLGRLLGVGFGRALTWMERLPHRDLVRVLRDVYVALNYAAGGYHVLYTRAVLLERPVAAKLALHHLREYTPVIRQASQLLAWAAALDVPPERRQERSDMKEIVETLVESWSTSNGIRSEDTGRPGAS